MTVFEIFFGLTAVVLGLALTHLAASVHHLLVARGRVRWAPEPILLAILVLVVIVFVWLNQWELRNETSVTMGEAMLQVLKLLVLYLAASFVLPAPGPSKGPGEGHPRLGDLGFFHDHHPPCFGGSGGLPHAGTGRAGPIRMDGLDGPGGGPHAVPGPIAG